VIAYADGEYAPVQHLLHRPHHRRELAISDESTELRFIAAEELDTLPMHHTQRLRINHYLERRDEPYLC